MAGVIPYGTATAMTANQYMVSSLSASVTLGPGVSVLVKIPSINTNTGGAQATLTLPGTAAIKITLASGGPIPPGALATNQLVIFSYDDINNHWQISEGFVSALVSVDQYDAMGYNNTHDSGPIGLADAAGNLVFSSGKTYVIDSNQTYNSQAVFAPGGIDPGNFRPYHDFQSSPVGGGFHHIPRQRDGARQHSRGMVWRERRWCHG
jgi:hypothetical protein